MLTGDMLPLSSLEGEAGNGLVYKPQEWRDVRGHWDWTEGRLATHWQNGCYYRPYKSWAAAEEWGDLVKVCACGHLKLYVVSIVAYLQNCGCYTQWATASYIVNMWNIGNTALVSNWGTIYIFYGKKYIYIAGPHP